MGDYLFINTVPEHGLVIIGWQKAMDCAEAMFADGVNRVNGYREWAVTDFGRSYIDALGRGIPYPVPWVADFTSPANADNTKVDNKPCSETFLLTIYFEPYLDNLQIRRSILRAQLVFLHNARHGYSVSFYCTCSTVC